MEDELNGGQEEGAPKGAPAQTEEGKDYEKLLADQAKQIADLQAQVADAAKTAETAELLTKQIEDMKAEAEAERIDFKLTLAGCRSVRAGKALLEEHGGDIDALKAAEPWLFAEDAPAQKQGKTGLEPAGVAGGSETDVERWRALAGLDD